MFNRYLLHVAIYATLSAAFGVAASVALEHAIARRAEQLAAGQLVVDVDTDSGPAAAEAEDGAA